MTTDYQFLDGNRHPRLAHRVDPAQGTTRARVLMVHGYAEHSARYDHVVELWCSRGLTVARFDQRGHGRSEGPRGHVAHFGDYVDDVRRMLAHLEQTEAFQGEGRPLLFGHSMGGLVAVLAAAELGNGISGLGMTSPYFGLKLEVPKVQVWLAHVAARIAPGLRQPSGLKGTDVTHDPKIAASYDSDPLGFHHATAGWFVEVLGAQARVAEIAPRLQIPLFCIAAGADPIVSVPATRRFFELAGSREKELDVREGLFHEVLNELDWKDHAERLCERMLRWASTQAT